MSLNIAIIGAGLSGLTCLRHLTCFPRHTFTVKAYEQTSEIGGTWVYTDKTGVDEETGLPILSSMYKNLRTNLPKQVMCYQDFPFNDHLPTFLHHTDVFEYLKRYAHHYDLYQHIQFNTEVVTVTPLSTSTLIGDRQVCQWEVETCNVLSREKTVEKFDIVLVCNGHFSKPYCNVRGLNNFKGKVLHSHNYRIPEPFTGQCVLIIGGGPSGIDICLEVAKFAQRVILSNSRKELRTDELKSSLPKNINEVEKIIGIKENGIIELNTNETINGDGIDAIIVCTGYDYDFPFLAPQCGIQVSDNRVYPLYKHSINAKHPSMAFIGLNFRIIPALISETQIKFYRSFLLGQFELPCQEIMEKEGELDYQQHLVNGYGIRYAHCLGGELMWTYVKELATMGNFDAFKPVVKSLFKEVRRERTIDVDYKNIEFEVIDDERWKRL